MSKGQFRLPVNQRRVAVKGQGTGHMRANANRPVIKKNESKAAIMAAIAIKAAKAQRPFKRPSLDLIKDIVQVAVYNLLGPDLPPWSNEVEKELVEKLKLVVDQMAGGHFMRLRAVREVLMQAANRSLSEMEPLMPFQAAPDAIVERITKVAAKRRRSASRFKDFTRSLLAYCEACLRFTGKSAVRTYLFIYLQRRMEGLKDQRYVRMPMLRDMLEVWIEEEIGRIENLLIQVAEGQGGGHKLHKRESPRGNIVYELIVRFQSTRKCYLIAEETPKGKRRIVALKTQKDYRRNVRKRFNRNARNTFANLPRRLRY